VSALSCRPPLTLCRPRYSSTWGRACWSVRPYLALVPAARALGLPSAAAIGAQALLATGPLMIGILKVSSHRRPGEPTIALRRVPTVAATLGWAADDLRRGRRVRTHKTDRRLARAHGVPGLARLLETPARDSGRLQRQRVAVDRGPAPHRERAHRSSGGRGLFRGYLPPRMPVRLSRPAPVAHAVLFALYHVWTLWLTLTRILAILPLIYITLRTRSVLPAMGRPRRAQPR